ncbi:MAG: CoA pyrophosphatase [Cytophagales bacterium]|nr:MAG: CoA pyrophosphatase [Cytophagales bacterium]
MMNDLIQKIRDRLPHLEDVASHTFGNQPRFAAVMISMYFVGDELYLPFIVRPAYDGVHSGQVAFAGGKAEETDRDRVHTAMREAEEEIGITVLDEHIIGVMPQLYVVPSNMLVTPVIACLPERPHFVIDPNEVAKVLEVPVAALLNPANHSTRQVVFPNNVKMKFPSYLVQGEEIWGATGRMISELFKLIN